MKNAKERPRQKGAHFVRFTCPLLSKHKIVAKYGINSFVIVRFSKQSYARK